MLHPCSRVISLNESDAVLDSDVLLIVSSLILVAYVLFLVVPGVFLNYYIVSALIRSKTLRTPLNLFMASISLHIILYYASYGFLSVPAFFNTMVHCDCSYRYYQWFLAYVFKFTLYPLQFCSVVIAYFLVVRKSSRSLTFCKVLSVITIIWIITLMASLPILIVVPQENFSDFCSCLCDPRIVNLSNLSGSVLLLTSSSKTFFECHDCLLVILPVLIVAVFTTASYCTIKKSLPHFQSTITRKMLFLPVVVTGVAVFFLPFLEIINWQERSLVLLKLKLAGWPGNFLVFVLSLLWDMDGIVYGCMILYFNHGVRMHCADSITGMKNRMKNKLYRIMNWRRETTQPAETSVEKHKDKISTVACVISGNHTRDSSMAYVCQSTQSFATDNA